MGCMPILIKLFNSLRRDNSKMNSFDLQRFAGEKTEEPTAKRKSESRQKGQVPKSMDFSSSVILLAAFFSLQFIAPYTYKEISGLMRSVFTQFPTADFTIASFQVMFMDYGVVFLKASLPIMVVILVVSLVINYLQVGFLFTLQPLTPSLSKINPINGLGRMFSMQSLVELIKSIIKISVVSFFIYRFAQNQVSQVAQLMHADLIDLMQVVGSMTLKLAFQIITVLLVLSILDYYFQWWQNNKNMKMDKQEVKEEMKQSEGDPQVKGKIKERQRALALKRMMQEVPKADVIITNPTHFAVALKYDADMAAPIVVAKGQDYIAQKIKTIAKEHAIVIVENRMLARALYSSVEIGDIIPAELYQAVAEVLAYVYRLKKRLS
jgi:flagellar biosynthesis protein FlhB